MARFESEAVRIVRRNPALLAIGGFSTAILTALWASRGFEDGSTSALIAGAVFGWIWIRNPAPLESAVALVADARGISYDGEPTFPRDVIVSARVQPDAIGSLVAIAIRDGAEVTLRVPTQDMGRALVDALALHGRRTLTVFRARPFRPGVHTWDRGQTLALASMAVLYALLARFHIGTGIAFAAPLVLFGLQHLVSGRVLVGADGFRVEWFGSRRFVAFRDVDKITTSPRAVGIALRSGERIDLLTPMRHYADAGERDALHLALAEGSARASRAAGDNSAEAVVARGERSIHTWLEDVRTLGDEAPPGYRAAALPTPELWRIVEDPAAEPSARAGAAIALRPTLDDVGLARVRVAAEASTSPWVRIALDPAFADGSDRELAEALEAVDAEARAADSGERG